MAHLQLVPRPSPSSVDLLYFRPKRARCEALDQALRDVAAAHRGRLRLVVKHSDEHGYLLGGWVSGTAPTVLLVRDGTMLAQFVGVLPTRDIQDLVRSALAAPPGNDSAAS